MNVDWPTGVITVYKTDPFMSLVSGNIYDMDTNSFRLAIKAAEATAYGMAFPDVTKHNSTVLLGGIEYARTLEILAPYTITFDDTGGAWVCNLLGSNNNILDRTNLTSVQVRSNNSAGLVQVSQINAGVYRGEVNVDVVNGEAGSLFPLGTLQKPVNNLTDAKTIAEYYGIGVINVIGSLTVTGIDLSGFIIKGQNPILTSIKVEASADVTNCEFYNATVYDSVLDGNNLLRECSVHNLTYVEGILYNCSLAGNIQIANPQNTYLLDCKSGCVGLGDVDLPKIDLSNGECHVAIRNWSGPLKIINSSNAATTMCIDVTSGATALVDSTVTAGLYIFRGSCGITHTQTGSEVISDQTTGALTWIKSAALTVAKFLGLK